MNKRDEFLDSVKAVKKKLLEEYDMACKELDIRSVMKKDLGMRFKKLVPVSL